MNIKFNKLSNVDLREAWASESSDFTPWLSKEENINELGNTIGLDLTFENSEHNVGPYRADIICKDQVSDDIVLIENQLERTNHKHLGQILTYASGTKAKTIVWIASEFTDEHRATLDWLNNHTSESFNFFGIEIELLKIGESDIAPNFKLVSKPNDWSKDGSSYKPYNLQSSNSDRQIACKDYWQHTASMIKENKSFLKAQKPRAQHWYNVAVGKQGFKIAGTVKTKANTIGAEIYISDNKQAFKDLESQKREIEAELGLELSWEYLEGKKASRIAIYREDANLYDESRWNEYAEWHVSIFERLHKVFSPRIKNLSFNILKEAA